MVIGLQTTGEARLKESLALGEEDVEDFRGLQACVCVCVAFLLDLFVCTVLTSPSPLA